MATGLSVRSGLHQAASSYGNENMDSVAADFRVACAEWLCNGYSLDVRYVGRPGGDDDVLWSAAIRLMPLPATQDNRLALSLPGVVAGQVQEAAITKDAAVSLIAEAIAGSVAVHNRKLVLPTDGPLQLQSTLGHRGQWSAQLSLQLFGSVLVQQSADLARLDDSLRIAVPPFDGLSDLGSWLGLGIPEYSHERCGISITVR